jgi:hypothetical protein
VVGIATNSTYQTITNSTVADLVGTMTIAGISLNRGAVTGCTVRNIANLAGTSTTVTIQAGSSGNDRRHFGAEHDPEPLRLGGRRQFKVLGIMAVAPATNSTSLQSSTTSPAAG